MKKKTAKKKILRKKPVKKSVKKKIVKKAPRKKVVKKSVKRKPAPKKKAAPKAKEKVIGKVTHYFPKVRAAVIKLAVPLAVGDAIKIKGHTTNFTQKITSLQIDRVPINSAKKGDEIGLLVDSRVRGGDTVYKA